MKQVRLPFAVFAVLAAFGFILSSCQGVFQQGADNETDIIAAKQAASASFADAQTEFFGLLEADASARGGSASASPTEEASQTRDWDLKDRLIAEAWTAYYSGDASELERLLKENGLYDQAMKLIDTYELKEKESTLALPSGLTDPASRSVGYSFFNTLYHGDVLVCYGGSSSSSSTLLGLLIPGHWKHAGIWDYDRRDLSYSVLSASNETDYHQNNPGLLGRVGYESKEKWIGESAVAGLRVNGRTAAKAAAAVNYGKTFIGKEFNFFVTRDSNDQFYCSKLVWRCWKSQNIDLEYNTWYYWRGQWVTPTDIWDDGDTSFIGGDSW